MVPLESPVDVSCVLIIQAQVPHCVPVAEGGGLSPQPACLLEATAAVCRQAGVVEVLARFRHRASIF